MDLWKVSCVDGAVVVSGGNWLAAVGAAVGELDLDPRVLERMVCDIDAGRSVVVRNPKSNYAFLIERLDEDDAPAAVDPDATTLHDDDDGDSPFDASAFNATLGEDDAADGDDAAPSGGEAADDDSMPMFLDSGLKSMDTGADDGEPMATLAGWLDANTADFGPSVSPRSLSTMPPAALEPLDQDTADAAPKAREPAGVVAVGEELEDEPALAADSVEQFEVSPTDMPPPALAMPKPRVAELTDASVAMLEAFSLSTEADKPPEDLDETLFMSVGAISDAESVKAAADAALGVLLDLVPADASAVLFAGVGDLSMRFIAARGPEADKVMSYSVPLDEGIAGFCHRMGASLIVQDASDDRRIHREVEQGTGYETHRILAAVMRDSAGTIHGCLELLNPPGRFMNWHLEAAESVATALADYIGAAGLGQDTGRTGFLDL